MTTKDSTPQVSVRLPPELVEEIDAAARQADRDRSGQIRHLLRSALAQSNSRRPGRALDALSQEA